MNFRVYLWVGFNLFVLAMLALDLGIAKRREEAPSTRASVAWCLVWIAVSLAIFGAIWSFWKTEKAFQFLTGYLVEYALSVDNLFVFVLIFGHFKVPARWQHKMLFWGIIGAFVMRASMIVAGVALVERFHWLFYFFGALLMVSAARLLWGGGDDEKDPEGSRIFRFARRLLPIDETATDGEFVVRKAGRLLFTPLFLVLLLVEVTDLLFALDSIPAVLSVSNDRFILYSSNVCAILGLRTLYFLVSALMAKLRYLNMALALVLAFIGVKMELHAWVDIPIFVSLGVIGGVLAIAILASVLRPRPA